MSKGGGGSSRSGFAALPRQLKESFTQLGTGIPQYTDPNNPGVTSMFTPMGQTADETQAFSMLRGGFAPTEESIRSNVAMQMNPYMDTVIDEVNRQAGGEFSMLKQAMNASGGLGSNREMLGANDIDLSRMNTIGGMLGNQYNMAMNNAMTTIPALQQQDAANLMQIGQFQRGLDTQTRQAPISALQTGTQMISPFVSGGKSTQPGEGIGSTLGGLGSLAMGAGMLLSDRRLKKDIEPAGKENGHNVYYFSYLGDGRRFIGVMADEIAESNPEAVIDVGGFMAVDYGKIGVEFREVQ